MRAYPHMCVSEGALAVALSRCQGLPALVWGLLLGLGERRKYFSLGYVGQILEFLVVKFYPGSSED